MISCAAEIAETCYSSPKPIDFIYERRYDKFNIEGYQTDQELLEKIQTGKGDITVLELGARRIETIYIDTFFSGTTPESPDQDLITGSNNLLEAKAARFSWSL